MEELKPDNTLFSSVEGLEYPVEFELRVIYSITERDALAVQLHKVLEELNASLEMPRRLPTSGTKYDRLACKVRFEDKDKLYKAYESIGALPGVKVVL